MKSTKIHQLGTVFVARAKIQYIDDTGDKPIWVTVKTCLDTPNAIDECLSKVRKLFPHKTLWVNSWIKGRYIP